MFLDDKLNFGKHLKYITNKVSKFIGLLHKRQIILPRRSLVAIYKSFNRPHLNEGDTSFDKVISYSMITENRFNINALVSQTVHLLQDIKKSIFAALFLKLSYYPCKPAHTSQDHTTTIRN